MTNAEVNNIAPLSIIIPTTTNLPARSANPHGQIFISGGYLCFVSGSVIVALNGGVSGGVIIG